MRHFLGFHKLERAGRGNTYPQFKGIEVVAGEGRGQYARNLLKSFRHFELFSRATDSEIVHEDVALLNGALRDAPDLSKFQIPQVLYANPNAGAKHREHQAQCASRWPQ